MRILLLPLVFLAGALASVPVRDSCGEDAIILANVQENDAIQVRHGVMGESIPCYAVSVTQSGSEVKGFILGTTLPSIQEFERKRSEESRVAIPPPPPPAPGEKKAAAPMTPIGPPFEPWSGADINGKRMQINPGAAKVTLVTFWAAQSGSARRLAVKLETTGVEFNSKGLKSFGIVEAEDVGRVKYYMEDMGLGYPQALDRQKLAAKYHADATKGTTLVIDSANNVMAVSSDVAAIRAAVLKLLAP